ncbi:peptide ABC transporter permease [Bacillus carboniphilus]|uniref:Peptide ABC transporter permease n=1 Tax=Bacillus carboniphilus TaxID=86663 RepID=A0ABP3GG98_9BACI
MSQIKQEYVHCLKRLAEQITDENISSYWAGFHIYPFAIYDDEWVYVASHPELPEDFTEIDHQLSVGPRTNHFIGNTAIEFAGEKMGIWKVDLEQVKDFDKLYAGMVHELFHVYQQEFGEKRFANELLFIQYPFTESNIAHRLMERESLYRAVLEDDPIKKHAYVKDFILHRETRRNEIETFLDYELAIETIEGTATYVELQACVDQKALQRESIISHYGKNLQEHQEMLAKFRASCYYSGQFIGLLLDHYEPGWQLEFMNAPDYLYDFFIKKVDAQIENEVELTSQHIELSKQLVQEYSQKQKEELAGFFQTNKNIVTIKGHMKLTGFDPMNIISEGEKLLHKHVIKIQTQSDEYVIFGPVLAQHTTDLWEIDTISFYVEYPVDMNGDSLKVEKVGEWKGTWVDSVFYLKT